MPEPPKPESTASLPAPTEPSPSQSAATPAPEPPQPAQADDALRWQLYNDLKKQAWDDIQSSTDSYDQAMLTLSTGGLGLSIAFIKDIVPLQQAVWLPVLYVSWGAFAACILTTIVSFLIAMGTQREHLDRCYAYLILKVESAKDDPPNRGLWFCTRLAGALFVVALACTIFFAVQNVRRYSKMPPRSDTSKPLQEGRGPVQITPVPNAAAETRGRAPVQMTPSSPAQPNSPPANTQSNTTTANHPSAEAGLRSRRIRYEKSNEENRRAQHGI